MRRARFWLGACLSLVAGTTVPARHPTASALPLPSPPPPPAPAIASRPAPPGEGVPVAPDEPSARLAVAFNAAVPLARSALAIAAPFRLDASAPDLARAADCLAAAGYYEAGSRAADQRAVLQVVLNRVRHRAFPATVCGVVFEGAERRTGCQFTFTCDGAMLRRTPSALAWQQARALAAQMLRGEVEPAVGLATHYHTDWVSPAWDRTMDKIAAVRSHLFYRWRGLQTFTMRHAGHEPAIPQMARLSQAHGLPLTLATDQTAPLAPAAPAFAAAAPRLQSPPALALAATGVFLVTLPADGGPESFRALAARRCAGLRECRVIGWTDPARTPRALPMPGSSVDTIAFVFERRDTGSAAGDKARWDCARYAPGAPGQCI
ncbi:cell wall hydrolase [Novosphingobium resinovorum]|uniref:cell wall hydrolase n=1 Tax=Novosphingobium resinovorum TaxID=158500 RepID=UPI002ED3627D|nr:cell wall hydrolase [Novosphingobium resinovorum]